MALRQLSTRYAHALTGRYATAATRPELIGWSESTLARRERRLDRALQFKFDGRRHLFHLEFQWRWTADMPTRMFEYQAMLALAMVEEFGGPPPPIKSVVVLLDGPMSVDLSSVTIPLSWPRESFTGMRFTIDRIYSACVADLVDRGDPFWLALTPLTRDATAPTLREVLVHLQETEDDPKRQKTTPRRSPTSRRPWRFSQTMILAAGVWVRSSWTP